MFFLNIFLSLFQIWNLCFYITSNFWVKWIFVFMWHQQKICRINFVLKRNEKHFKRYMEILLYFYFVIFFAILFCTSFYLLSFFFKFVMNLGYYITFCISIALFYNLNMKIVFWSQIKKHNILLCNIPPHSLYK